LGLTSLDQLPSLQQLTKEDMQGGMLAHMDTHDVQLQVALDQDAMNFTPVAGSVADSEALPAPVHDENDVFAFEHDSSVPPVLFSEAEIMPVLENTAPQLQIETVPGENNQEPNDESSYPQ